MKTFEITIIRTEFGDDYTGGKMLVEGIPFCDTIEPTDRHLDSSMSLSEIKKRKVYGRTAIPYGRYEITLEWSPRLHGRAYAKKYGGKFPCFNAVPGWSGVLLHPFNRGTESQGCIAPGERWKAGTIINSTLAYTDFMDYYFLPAIARCQEVWVTIKRADDEQ